PISGSASISPTYTRTSCPRASAPISSCARPPTTASRRCRCANSDAASGGVAKLLDPLHARRGDRLFQPVAVEGLHDEAVHARLAAGLTVLREGIGGERDDGDAARLAERADLPRRFEAVHARQV